MCTCVVSDRGWTEDKVCVWVAGGVRPWSHNTLTANNKETKLPAQPIQTHSPHLTTLLWQREEGDCVCVCRLWGGVVI